MTMRSGGTKTVLATPFNARRATSAISCIAAGEKVPLLSVMPGLTWVGATKPKMIAKISTARAAVNTIEPVRRSIAFLLYMRSSRLRTTITISARTIRLKPAPGAKPT